MHDSWASSEEISTLYSPLKTAGLPKTLVECLLEDQVHPQRSIFGWRPSYTSSSTGPVPKRSYERERPPGSPQSPTSPRSEIPPFAPEVPSSPSTTASTVRSSSMASDEHHWAERVFMSDISATPLPRSGDISKCYGPILPDARAKLEAEYDELFQL